ncbi:DUF3793 family protein [Trichloromonas sp.]|uniref:DUF3793 family protein n=1 Tax=Trichloromonas sp. TaxID=3069249 RepID=UPI002A41EAF9|nr:DUF3793 family protein [Trichloromonas sp.]
MQPVSPFPAPDRSRRYLPPLSKTAENRMRKISCCNRLGLTTDFPDDPDALVVFLSLEAAEVLAEIKPASIIRLIDRQQPYGRNLSLLWRSFSDSRLADSKLQTISRRENGGGNLLLFFTEKQLYRQLRDPSVPTFLRQLGLSICFRSTKHPGRTAAPLPHRFRPAPRNRRLSWLSLEECGRLHRTHRPTLQRLPSTAHSEHFIDCLNRMTEHMGTTRKIMSLLCTAPTTV